MFPFATYVPLPGASTTREKGSESPVQEHPKKGTLSDIINIVMRGDIK